MGDRWQIRPARPADAPELAQLERRCFTDPWSAVAFEEMLRFPLTVALLAERNREIEGYLIGRSIAGEGEILNLAVVPEQRRHGLGSKLLEAGLTALTDAGSHRVWLEVRESNEGAQAMYLKRGFSSAGRRKKYYKSPVEDALILQLGLPSPLEKDQSGLK